MDNDLTVNSLSFVQRFSTEIGSERRETSRGVNLPEILSIGTRPYTDSKTKLKGVETKLRDDRYVELTAGGIGAVSATLRVAYPEDSGVGEADILAVVNRIATIIASTTHTGLNHGKAIFVDKEQ